MEGTAPPPGLDEYVASLQGQPQQTGQPQTGGTPAPEGLDDYVEELKQQKYGTLGQMAITGAEGLAEGVLSSPVSRALELGTGLTTAEDIKGRAEANPITKTGTEIAGLVGSSMIPGGQGSMLAKAGELGAKGIGAVEKASFLSKVGAQAAKSAFEGGLYQAGREVGDMVVADPQVGADFSLTDVGLATVMGGVFGGAFGAAAQGVKKAAVEAAPFLQDVKEGAAAKALKLKGEDAKDMARILMDAEINSGEKIFSPFAGSDTLSKRVESLRTSADERMGNIYTKLDEAGAPGVNPLKLASKIDEQLGDFWRSPINKSKAAQLENVLESVLLRGDKDISFKEAQQLQEEVKKLAYPNGKSPIEPTPRIQIAQDAHKIIDQEIDKAVDSAASHTGDSSLSSELTKAKKEYGAAEKAGRALANRVSSEQGNKLFGLTDTIAGIGLGASAGLGPAGAALVLKRLAEKYGNTAIATSKDTYLKHMDRFASAFGLGADARNASALARSTAKGFNTATNAVKSIFNKGKEMPSKVVPILSGREKLDRLVADNTKDPNRMYSINDNNPVEQYSAPYAATTARAVSYLNSIKPNTDPQAPLDSRRPASGPQKAEYNRALDIAQQPLVTLKYIQDGTLTTKDMRTLTTIYPSLYSHLSQKLMTEMTEKTSKGEAIPYKTRQSLSLFLQQPLDSTMTPQSIQAAQPQTQSSMQGQPVQGNSGPHPAYSSVKGLDSLAKSARTPAQAATARASTRD